MQKYKKRTTNTGRPLSLSGKFGYVPVILLFKAINKNKHKPPREDDDCIFFQSGKECRLTERGQKRSNIQKI